MKANRLGRDLYIHARVMMHACRLLAFLHNYYTDPTNPRPDPTTHFTYPSFISIKKEVSDR